MALQNDSFKNDRKPVLKFNPLRFGHSRDEDYQKKGLTKLSILLKIKVFFIAIDVSIK